MGYKIIDYAGDVVKEGLQSKSSAWGWIYSTYGYEFAKNMEFKVVREEEEDERDGSEL